MQPGKSSSNNIRGGSHVLKPAAGAGAHWPVQLRPTEQLLVVVVVVVVVARRATLPLASLRPHLHLHHSQCLP
jgi:hypothetical protein